MLFAAGHAVFPDAASAKTFDIPSAYWLQAIVSLGTALAAFTIAALLAGAWAGVAAAALVGFYPPLILATGEQLDGAVRRVLGDASRSRCSRSPRGSSKAWVFGLGGLALGAAVLTRADLLPVPFVLAPLVAVWTWRAAHDLKRGLLVGGLHPRRRAAGDRAVERLRLRSARASSSRSRAGRARRCSSAPTCPATGRRWG